MVFRDAPRDFEKISDDMNKSKKPVSRTRSALINIISNCAYQVVNTVVNIILPRLIIGSFGSVINGLITTVKQIMGYVQLVGAGISESTVVSLYEPLDKKDEKKISSIYNAVGKTFNRAGCIFSLISALVATVYPLLISVEGLSYPLVVLLILIISISGLSEFLLIGKYRALLTADQKIFVVNIAQIIGALGSTLLAVAMLKLGFGIVVVQFAAAMTYALRIAVLSLYIRKHYGYLDKTAAPDASATSRRGAATVHSLATLVIFGSQTIFISHFCGFAEASVYGVYNLVFTGINTLISTVSTGMLAGMGSLLVADDKERVRGVYEIYELVFQIITYTVYMTTILMILPFVKIYTSGFVDADYIRPEFVLPLALMGLLNCLRTPGSTVINAKGHYAETKNRALIEAAICLVGQLALVNLFGVVGVILGTAAAFVYRAPDIIIYSNRRILERSPLKSFARAARFALPFALAYLVAMKLQITPAGYFEWALYAAVVAVASFASLFVIALIFDRKYLFGAFGYAKEILKRR